MVPPRPTNERVNLHINETRCDYYTQIRWLFIRVVPRSLRCCTLRFCCKIVSVCLDSLTTFFFRRFSPVPFPVESNANHFALI